MTTLHDIARAKINLFLHVTGRRDDGYHELDSLAVFAPAADRLGVDIGAPLGGRAHLTIRGPFSAGLAGDDTNLVIRAASLMRSRSAGAAKLPDLAFSLDKRLPVASGIGGGSADAAAALRLLARAWGMSAFNLEEVAAQLGADVPVCLTGEARRMQGIGERLLPAPRLPSAAILLVNPLVAVPTPAVFAALRHSNQPFRAPADLPAEWPTFDAMCADLRATENDLQACAIALYPEIATVIEAIAAQPGCGFSRMSGSGATCFGLFKNVGDATLAARNLSRAGWWTDAGTLPPPVGSEI